MSEPRRKGLLLLLLSCVGLPRITADNEDCGVWFAASTIPGAGFGLFAGKAYEAGSHVIPGDLTVPLQELAWNNGFDYWDDEPHNLWLDYYWNHESFNGHLDYEGMMTYGASFGYGAVPNCYFPLINLIASPTQYDGAGVKREDPGAGAFTPYHDRAGVAKSSIAPGMELFVSYGQSYFEEWDDDPQYPVIPRLKDFSTARPLLLKLAKLVGDGSSADETCLEETCATASTTGGDLLTLVDGIATLWRSRVLETLPKQMEQLSFVLQHGLRFRDFVRSQRSVKELANIGLCMDYIEADLSTLPHAGRGAFTRHILEAGQVVVPVPLLQFPRYLYDMYEGTWQGNHYEAARDRPPVQTQLIINYCFGHAESSLLLCPYGSGASLINHSRKGANVRLRWSKKVNRRPEWFNMSVPEWIDDKAGLTMDVIALREILPGEEILLDYGDAWEAAWQVHVAQWQPPPEAVWYRPAMELNEDADLIVRISSEGSYGGLVEVLCRERFRQFQGMSAKANSLHSCAVVDRYQGPDGAYRYRAEIFEEETDDEEEAAGLCSHIAVEVLWDLPRDAFWFEDTMYSRDHLQHWSFRHEMGIPDDMFPQDWKDKR